MNSKQKSDASRTRQELVRIFIFLDSKTISCNSIDGQTMDCSMSIKSRIYLYCYRNYLGRRATSVFVAWILVLFDLINLVAFEALVPNNESLETVSITAFKSLTFL